MNTFTAKLLPGLLILLSAPLAAQPPVASFSLVPNPVCAGSVLQINDASTGSPTSWSYTISTGFGPGNIVLTTQNPTVILNFAGTATVTLIASNSSGASQPAVQTLTVLPSPNAQINPPLRNTCIGGNPVVINVQAGGPGSGPLTFSWSTSTSGPSITVQPTVTTTYTCTITGTNGCSVVRTVTVVVGTPTVSIASTPYSICPGSAATLVATGTTPQPFSYTWSTAASTRSISTTVPGVYDVTVTNGQGCTGMQSYTLGTSSTLSLTASANPSAICTGSATLLNVTGASSYTWSHGSNAPVTLINPSVTTTYTVAGTLSTCTGTGAVTVIVNVIPTIAVVASPPSLCAGKSSTLSANGAGTYTWLPSTVSQTLVVTPSVTTTYTVRGINQGCPARTGTISINVLPTPSLVISTQVSSVCAGELVVLAAGGANTYTWSSGSTSTVILVYPTSNTTYTLWGTASNQCTAEVSYAQVVDPCTALTAIDGLQFGLEIFPNPCEGSFELRSVNAIHVTLLDLSGRQLSQASLSAGESMSFTGLKPGLYLVNASDGGNSVFRKVLVTR